jgi:GT2 family glycosyltransferase
LPYSKIKPIKGVLIMSNSITVAFSTFRETYLEWVVELLKSLENQTMQDFEVIVVVNGNKCYSKKLLDAVKYETAISHEINVIFNSVDKGIAHSRNIALKHAKTPYIAYTDDDAIPHSRWLEELLRVLELNGKVGAVTGPVLCRWEHGTENCALWFPKELYWIIGCTSLNIKKVTAVRNGFASNLALKREIVLKIGGFSENFGYNPRNPMVGEEPQLGIRLMRAGYVTLWNPNAIVYHRIFGERLKIRNILIRSFIEGKTKAYLSQAYGSNVIKLEVGHLQSVIKGFIKTRSPKSKALLLLTTIAVLSGYLTYCR